PTAPWNIRLRATGRRQYRFAEEPSGDTRTTPPRANTPPQPPPAPTAHESGAPAPDGSGSYSLVPRKIRPIPPRPPPHAQIAPAAPADRSIVAHIRRNSPDASRLPRDRTGGSPAHRSSK